MTRGGKRVIKGIETNTRTPTIATVRADEVKLFDIMDDAKGRNFTVTWVNKTDKFIDVTFDDGYVERYDHDTKVILKNR